MKSVALILLLVGLTLTLLGICNVKAQQQQDSCDYTSLGITPFPFLDVDLLYDKKWYVQEIFARRPEDVIKPTYECFMQYLKFYVGVDFTLEQYTGLSSEIATFNTSTAMQAGTGEKLAVFYVDRNGDRDQYTAVWTHTDYSTYGVIHWCPYASNPEEATDNYERVLTFTGVPSPDAVLLADLRLKVASLGFPTEYAVQINHHDGCDYDVCEAVNASCCDTSLVNAPPMQDFDMEQLHDTVWYVQEIFFTEPVDYVAPTCWTQWLSYDWIYGIIITDIYTPIDSVSNQFFGSWTSVNWDIWNSTAIWKVSRQFERDAFTIIWTHTDYEHYAVVHYCPQVENAEWKHEAIFLLTGAPQADVVLLRELRLIVAAELGFPKDYFAMIEHHDDCDYNYNP